MSRNYLLVVMFAVALATVPSVRAIAGNAKPDSNGRAQAPQQPNDSFKSTAGKSMPAKSGPAKRASQAGKPAAAIALSQTAEAPTKLPRMVIVVTATRMATPIGELGTVASVVGARSIESQQIHEANDALREVPGVQVRQSGSPGSVTEVSIRGSTSAQTLIMIDGVP